MKEKHPSIHIELLRCIACFLVIFNHTAYSVRNIVPGDLSKSRIVTLLLYFFCKTAVPLFLLIAGANLLNKKDTPQKTFKRIRKIIALIIIGSLPYLFTDNISIFSSEYWIGLYEGNYNAYIWYLYLYLGILLMLPLLQSIHLSAKQHLYLLLVYLFGPGLFPLLRIYFSIPAPAAPLYYAIPSCYVILLLTGDYLENKIDLRELTAKRIAGIWAVLVFSVGISFITAIHQLNTIGYIDYDSVYGTTYYSFTVSISICTYLLVRYYFHSIRTGIIKATILQFGKYTLGIYLFGEFIRVRLEFLYDYLKANMSHLLSVLIYSVCIFITGAFIMFIFYSAKNIYTKKDKVSLIFFRCSNLSFRLLLHKSYHSFQLCGVYVQ